MHVEGPLYPTLTLLEHPPLQKEKEGPNFDFDVFGEHSGHLVTRSYCRSPYKKEKKIDYNP